MPDPILTPSQAAQVASQTTQTVPQQSQQAPSAPSAPGAPQAAPAAPAPDPMEAVKAAQRELFNQREAWKKERAEAEAKWAETQKTHAERLKAAEEAERFKRNLKRDPMGSLKELGLPWEELQETALQDGKPTAGLLAKDLEERMEARIREVQEAADRRIAEMQKAADEYRQKTEQQAEQAWRHQTTEWVKAAGEQYELVNLYGLQANVAELMKNRWETNGENLSREQAAAELEKNLQAEVDKLKNTKYFKSVSAPPAPAEDVGESKPKAVHKLVNDGREELKREKTPAAPTLTNDLAPSTAPVPDNMSPAARWEFLKRQHGL